MSDNSWLTFAEDALSSGDGLEMARTLSLLAIAEELHRMNERNEPQTMSAESIIWLNDEENQ